MGKFSKKEAIKFGWNAAISNIGFFIGLQLLYLVIFGALRILTDVLFELNSILGIITFIIYYILVYIMVMGLIKISIKFADNEKAKISDLFSQAPLFFKYLAGNILYVLIVLFGLILLIVPGIIWAIKFKYFNYLIIDKKLGPIKALKASSRITMGAKLDLFVFGILLTLILIAGILALFIGIFVASPIIMVATAYVYRKLLAAAGTK